MTAPAALATPIGDEHSVLLWQTCAYADDFAEAVSTGRRMTAAYDAMLEFLHYRLLPYLADEERHLSPSRIRDDHLLALLAGDHDRLRDGVEDIGSGRTPRMIARAATDLVNRLDRHVDREQRWLGAAADDGEMDGQDWALPLVFGDLIDVDALPPDHRDDLIRRRLTWMRSGDSLRLQAGSDLHSLWLRMHAVDHDRHLWVYEESGPSRWRVRITRRPASEQFQ